MPQEKQLHFQTAQLIITEPGRYEMKQQGSAVNKTQVIAETRSMIRSAAGQDLDIVFQGGVPVLLRVS